MFIYVLSTLIFTLVLSHFLPHYFRNVKRRREGMHKKNASRKRAVITAKGLVEKIRLAAHSRAPQEEKDAVKDHIRKAEELIMQFDLDFLRDLGINKNTLRKHVHMATVDETKMHEMLTKIRAGKFGVQKKVSSPRIGTSDDVIPFQKVVGGDIVMEDAETGITVVIDLSYMYAHSRTRRRDRTG